MLKKVLDRKIKDKLKTKRLKDFHKKMIEEINPSDGTKHSVNPEIYEKPIESNDIAMNLLFIEEMKAFKNCEKRIITK